MGRGCRYRHCRYYDFAGTQNRRYAVFYDRIFGRFGKGFADGYSKYAGNAEGGYMYVFAFLYDGVHRPIDRGYYELVWGSGEPQTVEAEKYILKQIEAEEDSLRIDSTYETISDKILKSTK